MPTPYYEHQIQHQTDQREPLQIKASTGQVTLLSVKRNQDDKMLLCVYGHYHICVCHGQGTSSEPIICCTKVWGFLKSTEPVQYQIKHTAHSFTQPDKLLRELWYLAR